MKKKKMAKRFNISNKLAYTLIAILSIMLVAVGVYAYGNPGTPTTLGHSTGELMPSCTGILTGTSGVANSWGCISATIPTCTGAKQGITWTGSAWSCVNIVQ